MIGWRAVVNSASAVMQRVARGFVVRNLYAQHAALWHTSSAAVQVMMTNMLI